MEAGKWFGRLGYQLPHGISQADFIVDIASGEVSTAKIGGKDARLHCIACAEKFLEAHPDGYMDSAQIKDLCWGATYGLLQRWALQISLFVICRSSAIVRKCLRTSDKSLPQESPGRKVRLRERRLSLSDEGHQNTYTHGTIRK
jgi:hypothetical protein